MSLSSPINLAPLGFAPTDIREIQHRKGTNQVFTMTADGDNETPIALGGGAGVDWGPQDVDGDGLVDGLDSCPQSPGPAPDGCPPPGPALAVGGIAEIVDSSDGAATPSTSGLASNGLYFAIAMAFTTVAAFVTVVLKRRSRRF